MAQLATTARGKTLAQRPGEGPREAEPCFLPYELWPLCLREKARAQDADQILRPQGHGGITISADRSQNLLQNPFRKGF